MAGALIAACVVLGGASSASAQVRLLPVGTFVNPVFMTAPPGDHRRLFVVEQPGQVRVVRDGTVLADPFLDISGLVTFGGEQGFLSIAFAPDYATTRKLYAYYTDRQGDNRIEEFERSATSEDLADPASRRTVLVIPHPTFGNHNGGQLQFGKDGLLYAAPGDGGSGDDPSNNAQRLDTLLGKLLRIDPRAQATAPYLVPADNPFVGRAGARGEIYAYGLRNPWRFSFDRETGDLTIGDVGQGTREEIDFALSGAGAGANYGWRVYEGTLKRQATEDAPGHVPPVLEYARVNGNCAVTGGYVVRDAGLPALLGRYVYGDYCKGELRSAVLAAGGATGDRLEGPIVAGLSSFGEDAAGCVYAASLSGVVQRLAAEGDSRPVPCPAPPGQGGGDQPPTGGEQGGSQSGGGGPAGGGDPAAGADRRAPGVRLRARRRQRPLRRRAVVAAASCDEPCRVTGSAALRVPGARALVLRSRTLALRRDQRGRLTLRLSRRVRRLAGPSLRKPGGLPILLTVTAVDAAGNRATARRRIALLD